MHNVFQNNAFRFGMTFILTLQYSLLRTTEWSAFVKPLPIIFWFIVVGLSAQRPAAKWVMPSLLSAAIGDVLLDLGPEWLMIATVPFLGSTLILAFAFHLRGEVASGKTAIKELLLFLPILALATAFHLFMAPRMANSATIGAVLLLISSLLIWRALSSVVFSKASDDTFWVRLIGCLGASGIVANYILYSVNIGLHPVPRDLVIQLYYWGTAFAAWSFLKPTLKA